MSKDRSHPLFFESLRGLARSHGENTALVANSRGASYATIFADARELIPELDELAGRRVAVILPASRAWVAALAALDCVGAHVYLVNPEIAVDRLAQVIADFNIEYSLREDLRPRKLRPPLSGQPEPVSSVTLLTSGTTGKPKGVLHDWASLQRPVRIDARFAGTRWLLTNPPSLYAGLQVSLQCLLNAATLVVLPTGLGPPEICDVMLKRGIQYVSATPSFWRRLLSFGSTDALRQLPLRQITLGGEVATPRLLRDLRCLFPDARLSHIYATSELGRCFTVTDGRPGFPARFLDDAPEPGVSLRIVDGELQVQSPNRMLRYDVGSGLELSMDDWISTGDLVDVVGDRVVFRGRRSDLINVGGHKVRPIEVETTLCQVEGVAQARVYPVASSIVGNLVAADVVAEAGWDEECLRRKLVEYCARTLDAHQRPRQLTFVRELPLTGAGKVTRQETL